MKPPIWYVAHPVGAATPEAVRANCDRARRWLRWLIDHEPEAAFCAPWLPYLDVLADDNGPMRARGLRDNGAIAARCDGIVLCGGTISSGMGHEVASYRLARDKIADFGVADLTRLGTEPPVSWPREISPLAEGRQRWLENLADNVRRIPERPWLR